MPYIGNTIRAADDYRLIDDISSGFNGSETSFALQVAGSAPVPFPKSPQQVLISVNGVIQEPDPTGSSGFNLVGTNIVFSSAPTNGHAFFGIIYATADYLNAGGNFPAGSLGAPSITFIGDENTGLFRKSGGSVGFVSDATEIANFDSNGITISSGNIIIPDSIIHNGDSNTKIRFPAADTITAETGGTERQRINSDGQLLINQTASSGVGRQLQIGSNTGFGGVSLNRFSADTGSSGLDFIKSRNATIGSNTIVQNDDNLGAITWRGADGTDFATPAAQIKVAVDGTPGSNDMPGRIMLFTTADGASSLTERMRIDSSGDVGIGVTSIDSALHVYKQTNNRTARFQRISSQHIDITQTAGINSFTSTGKDFEIGTTDSQSFIFDTNGSERMRIDSSGNVGIGESSPLSRLHIEDTSGAVLTLGNSQSPNDVVTGTVFGRINFFASDRTGTSATGGVARIEAIAPAGYGPTPSDLLFYTHSATANDGSVLGNPTERMRIDFSGNVGIGTTSPDRTIHCHNSSNTTNVRAKFSNGTTGEGASDGFEIGINASDPAQAVLVNYENSPMAFFTNASERMRLTSDGPHLLLGGTSDVNEITESAANAGMVIGGTGFGNAGLAIINSTSGTGRIYFGDALGANAGRNRGQINYAHSDDHMRFVTASSERMRINSSGNVGINQSNPNLAKLHVVGNSNDGEIIAKFKGGAGTANTTCFIALIAGYPDTANNLEGHAYIGVQRSGSGNQTKILFKTYSGDSGAMRTRMTINPNNNVDIQGKLHTQLGTEINSFNKETTGDQIRFNTTGTTRGSISSNGSTVSYNTTSDYRLKENEVAISDAITRLKALKPYRFNFKEQPSITVDGFFAHEVTPVIPEAVNGEKDAMAPLYYEEGDTLPEGKEIGDYKGLSTTEIQPQGLDQSKLVPLLTAALQEEISKREALETRIAALEAA